MARIFAAADIGSNTAHLLVAASDGDLVTRIDKFNEWIPIGEAVARQGEIPKEFANQLCAAVKEIKRVATDRRAEILYVFATEAMRSAKNCDAVIKRIHKETGVEVQVITPRREAELSVRGMTLDTRNLGVDMMFEVGGGSAQIAKIDGNQLVQTESLPLGTGRIIAESGIANPSPSYAVKAAQNYIRATLRESNLEQEGNHAVASGGVARGLWRAVHPDGEKTVSIEELEYVIWSTQRLSSQRIVERFNVKPKRAETLLPGALVYRSLMQHFGITEMMITEFGIREGAVLEMAGRNS